MRPMTDDTDGISAADEKGEEQLDSSPDILREMIDEMREQAVLLRAFDPGGFAAPAGARPDPERNLLAAGALMRAGNIVLTCLFEDTARLLLEQDSVAEEPDRMIVLDDLPMAFAHLYTHAFAERFIIVMAGVVGALHRPKWVPPSTIAERLAVHMLIKTARAGLEIAEVIDWSDSHEVFEPFRAAAFTDRDHELLYELERDDLPAVLRAEPSDGLSNELAHWFRPVGGRGFIHPFLRD